MLWWSLYYMSLGCWVAHWHQGERMVTAGHLGSQRTVSRKLHAASGVNNPERVVSRRVDLDICRQTRPPWSLMYWWQLSIRRDKYHIRGNDQLKEASGDTITTQIIKKISKHDVIVWSTLSAKPSYPCFCLLICEQQRIDVCFVGTLVTSTCNLCLFKEDLKWEFSLYKDKKYLILSAPSVLYWLCCPAANLMRICSDMIYLTILSVTRDVGVFFEIFQI